MQNNIMDVGNKLNTGKLVTNTSLDTKIREVENKYQMLMV